MADNEPSHATGEDAQPSAPLVDGARAQIVAARQRREALVGSVERRGSSSERSASLASKGFPGYTLLREVHRGGQGVVYEALQEATNRTVAIKVLLEGAHASRSAQRRFEREIELVAGLRHPNVITVFHSGQTADGLPFCVMDYVRGLPLTRYVRENQLTLKEALGLFATVCAAVHHAHQKGVIHRDLKPSNILVDAEGVPRVMDFGLAKLVGSAERSLVSMAGQVVGTLPYMSPEQARGNPDEIDTRTDVYALGVLLYELLTGRYPYPVVGPVSEVLRHIAETQPTPPSRAWRPESGIPAGDGGTRIRPFVASWRSLSLTRRAKDRSVASPIDDEVQTIILKALAKERERRYQSAGELARDVAHYLAGEPIEAKRDSTLYVLRKQLRRHRQRLAVASAFSLLLAVSSIVAWALYVSADREAKRASRSEEAATLSKDEATKRLWESYLAQARASRHTGRPGRRFDSMDAIVKAAAIRPGMELRNEAIACMGLIDVRLLTMTPVRKGNGSWPPYLSPQLSRYAVLEDDCTLSIRETGDDREVAHFPPPTSSEMLMPSCSLYKGFSADGRYLARGCSSRSDGVGQVIEVIDIEKQTTTLVSPVQSFDFSPDSRVVALAKPDGTLALHDTVTGMERKRLDLGYTPRWIAFSPDGQVVATVTEQPGDVRMYDVKSGQLTRTLQPPSATTACAWSPDGHRLVTACFDYNVYIWDSATLERTADLRGHSSLPVIVEFHPSTNLLLTSSWDGTARLWDPDTGKELLNMTGVATFGDNGRAIRFSQALGQGFVTGAFALEHAPQDYLCRLPSGGWYTGNSISSDGRLAASASVDNDTPGGVALWEVYTKKEIAHLSIGDTNSAIFEANEPALITSGEKGIYRWPIRHQSDVVYVGPPQPLFTDHATEAATLSKDELSLGVAASSGRQLFVLNLRDPQDRRLLPGHRFARRVALSPDGALAATGTWQGSGVRIWNARSGDLLRELPIESHCNADFSPDGKWLVTCSGQELCFWEVDAWECRRRIQRTGSNGLPGEVAFTTDGKLIALTHTQGFIHLIEMDTFCELARLEMASNVGRGLAFSPTGDRLLFATADAIQVWDLRAIREQLAKIGLDWDAPPFPPLTEEERRERESPGPLLVEVDLGELAPAKGVTEQ